MSVRDTADPDDPAASGSFFAPVPPGDSRSPASVSMRPRSHLAPDSRLSAGSSSHARAPVRSAGEQVAHTGSTRPELLAASASIWKANALEAIAAAGGDPSALSIKPAQAARRPGSSDGVVARPAHPVSALGGRPIAAARPHTALSPSGVAGPGTRTFVHDGAVAESSGRAPPEGPNPRQSPNPLLAAMQSMLAQRTAIDKYEALGGGEEEDGQAGPAGDGFIGADDDASSSARGAQTLEQGGPGQDKDAEGLEESGSVMQLLALQLRSQGMARDKERNRLLPRPASGAPRAAAPLSGGGARVLCSVRALWGGDVDDVGSPWILLVPPHGDCDGSGP